MAKMEKIRNRLSDAKARVRAKLEQGKVKVEHATEDGIAFAINHKGDVARYAGRAARGAVVVAKKSKRTGFAVGTGIALVGLAMACRRSMNKAKADEAKGECNGTHHTGRNQE